MVDEMAQYVKPDFMTIAEDMSYNHGPMLSKALFDEFLLPYYRRLIPGKSRNTAPVCSLIPTGDITSAVPWFIEAGIDGILPLERQSGVDVAKIRDLYPDFLMIGSFDKMCMFHTPAEIRAELERLRQRSAKANTCRRWTIRRPRARRWKITAPM